MSVVTTALGTYRWLLPAIVGLLGLGAGFYLGWQLPAAQRDAETAKTGAAEARLQAGSAQWGAGAEKLRADSMAALRARDAAIAQAVRVATDAARLQFSEEVAPLRGLSGPAWDCLRRPLSEEVLAPLRRNHSQLENPSP